MNARVKLRLLRDPGYVKGVFHYRIVSCDIFGKENAQGRSK